MMTYFKSYALNRFLPALLAICTSAIALGQNFGIPPSEICARKYKLADTCRYKLIMEESHDGKWDHTNVAVCELTVVTDSGGVPYDQIRWVSMVTMNAKDTTDYSSLAPSVKSYCISLDPRGKMDLPKITVPALTEPIQDFNTFFVAISPLIGMTKLTSIGDSSAAMAPVKADFSNGANIVKGEDCISISTRIVDMQTDKVMFRTDFAPPMNPCLDFISPDMNAPVVKGIPNNFQMVMRTGKDQFLVQYGREFFSISSTVSRADGRLLSATMHNKLDTQMKINCDKSYQNSQFQMPFSEVRELTLVLLPH